MENSTERSEELSKLLYNAYNLIEEGDLPGSQKILERALSVDFESPKVQSALKCLEFWNERVRERDRIDSTFAQAEYSIRQWQSFQSYAEGLEELDQECYFAVKRYVFTYAIYQFSSFQSEGSRTDSDIPYNIAHCYKELGDYEQAISHYQTALSSRPGDSRIMAELADCYALINEVRFAKAFFREAFYTDPRRVDLSKLESELVLRLVRAITELGYKGDEIKEWIPVYGVVYRVFTVRRELKPVEYGKLRQSIYSLEHEIHDSRAGRNDLIPRLLNRYFWLIEHYLDTGDFKDKVDEVMEKIRHLDTEIYNLYIR
ncbi:MAG: tetratricopeptide repeat protein [Spirochaetales bacterium]|nr:tetratricopeptide repeat protein [Spirochaetales bacterium]